MGNVPNFVLSKAYFIADLIVGFGLPVFIHLRYRGSEDEDRTVRRLFWLGVLIGLIWEVPIFLSAVFASHPVIVFLNEPPLHPLVFMVSHTLWDGGIFLFGVLLLKLMFGGGYGRQFRTSELLVFLSWGQISALAVETSSVSAGGWAFVIPYRWNVILFELRGHPITILPQLIWFAAPVVYYLIAVRLTSARQKTPEAPS
jgi:hypothetical protein